MRRLPALAALGLALASLCLWSLLLLPRHQALTLAALAEAPLEQLGIVEAPVWDDSPARLAARTKTSACAVSGPYPDPACTPGAIFASSTPAVICVSGYTKSVRNVPTKLKQQVYRQYGLAYPQASGSYEADHLIPLELGGSNDIANLFPEAAAPTPGFREKDLVENYLHQQVCDKLMPLPRAQEAIAHDWVAVYNHLSQSELAKLRAEYQSWADKN